LLVVGDRLLATASIYYDANNTQRVSQLARPVNLSQRTASNWSQVWQPDKQGFVSGFFAAVPNAWQAALGGEVLVGQCCIPIVTRTSLGPSAFAIHPAQIGEAKVPATPLLYYPSEHPKLGPWEGSNPTYGATTLMGGMAAIAGTRSLLYIGSNGMGPHCYGNGTGDKALDHTLGADHEKFCYDPSSSSKSSHAYPYRFQIWAYNLNDLAAVRAGKKKPWDVVPYGVWPFDLPIAAKVMLVGGVGYDAEHQRIYFAQVQADEPGGFQPIIHVFEVKGAASTASPAR